MKVTVCRKEHFNAAHQLTNAAWDEATNREVFGKCSNKNFHGHNYDLIVKVRGEIDPQTGYVIDMKVLKDIIHREVLDEFDHSNLNLDVAAFKNIIPTAENIAVEIWNRIRRQLKPSLDLVVVLYETERNFVEYDGN